VFSRRLQQGTKEQDNSQTTVPRGTLPDLTGQKAGKAGQIAALQARLQPRKAMKVATG
jgi:hypothetical protein